MAASTGAIMSSASSRVPPTAVRRILTAHQAYPGDRGDRLAGDVVLCRAETAGEDRRVGPPECLADRGGDPLLVVTHHGVPQAVPTDVGEPLADPGGVAVDDLTEQQLGADPDDLAAHALLPLCSLVRP